MFKQTLLATVIVLIAWSAMDFLVHGMLLQSVYQETAFLWRPEDQMHALLMSAVTLLFSFCVVSVYSYFIVPKSVATGLKSWSDSRSWRGRGDRDRLILLYAYPIVSGRRLVWG